MEALQRRDATLLRSEIKLLVGRKAGGQAHGLLEAVQRIDLVIDDAAHLQPETVGTQVDCRDEILHHALGN